MLDSSTETVESAEQKISELNLDSGINLVAVWNKCDLKPANDSDIKGVSSIIKITASEIEGIEEIKDLLVSSHSIKESAGSLVVTNARHFEALVNSKESLEAVKKGLIGDIPADLVAIDIRATLHHLGSISGVVHADDILGHIFSHFCIGK